ncbi:hypothetical protein NA645_14530 [Pseudomonas stutzeri]|uniref:hypothetical protein n=1 Tax=Stutzerimonas stutzeri TaxID=316 RepID=UPI0021097150|nr:hypothetical protein [Stutzerimonas stutzeri]MCQ4309204.1 hypothetical protein [Stutzerimonas stutzeri]
MKHTLVAAFATPTDASRTYGDLMSRGIAREQIHTVGADSAEIHGYDTPYSTAGSTVDRTHHESKVAHFFKSLFGHEPHEDHRRHATAYPEAVRRGATVLAVDIYDDDQLVRARDALEYNGAISIDDNGAGSGSTPGYAGPTSPYAGATGGDSHLDKHFVGTAHTTGDAGHSGSRHLDAGALGGSAAGTGDTVDAHTGSGDTGRYDVGTAAKRAGTGYPETTATSSPTGGGLAGDSVAARDATQGMDPTQAGTCSDRICVIKRQS